MQRENFGFIAGDHFGGEHNTVASLQDEMGMAPMRHAPQRSAVLALTAGAQNYKSLRRQIGGVFFFDRRGKICQISGRARGIINPVHTAARQADMPPIIGGSFGNARQARNVRRKCCDHNTPRAFGHYLVQSGGNIRFGTRPPFGQHIGAVANNRVDPLIAKGL